MIIDETTAGTDAITRLTTSTARTPETAATGFADMLDQAHDSNDPPALSQERLQEYLDEIKALQAKARERYCTSPADGAFYHGREVLGDDDEGLPVVQQSEEEVLEDFQKAVERAARWGQDLDDLHLLVAATPQYDGIGPRTGTEVRVGVGIPLNEVMEAMGIKPIKVDTGALFERFGNPEWIKNR